MSKRGHTATLITAALVTLVELGATLSGQGGDPVDLVAGWAPTRPGDIWAIILTAVGCAALFVISRFPLIALLTSSAAYIVFIMRDYEFGMTLPAMVAIFIVAAGSRGRFTALTAALMCLTATAVWIFMRTATITDSGVAILVWVAFGTVSAAFFFLPALFGELVRLRRLTAESKI